jgi:hypothetical protein
MCCSTRPPPPPSPPYHHATARNDQQLTCSVSSCHRVERRALRIMLGVEASSPRSRWTPLSSFRQLTCPPRLLPLPRACRPGSGMPPGVDSQCENGHQPACRQFTPTACPDPSSYVHKLEGSVTRTGDVEGYCSGDWTAGTIVDTVQIPASIQPGAYVLGWRWDCEETTQVWASCADVTISV